MINDIFSNIGKRIRLSRILTREKAVIFAFDHGFEHGPKDFPGERVNPRTIVKIAVRNKFSALMTTRGIARATWDIWGGKIPLILKVTSKTSLRPKEEQLLQSPHRFVPTPDAARSRPRTQRAISSVRPPSPWPIPPTSASTHRTPRSAQGTPR